MTILVAVDANIILSALLGGKPSVLLFDPRFRFITTAFTITEVRKYLPRLAQKLALPREELERLLTMLPVSIHDRDVYQTSMPEAEGMIGYIDDKDVDILALALRQGAYLWSQDKDFDMCGYGKVMKTYDFIA